MAFQGQKQNSGSKGYDKTKDIELFTADAEIGKSKFTVTVFSYNNGSPKLQLSKAVKNEETNDFAFVPKLGRFTKEEVKTINGLLAKAYASM